MEVGIGQEATKFCTGT